MQFLDRLDPRWAVLTVDLVQAISPGLWGIKRPGKFGIFVGSTMRRKHWIWAWLIRLYRVDDLEKEGLQWASEVMEKSPLAIRCLKSAFNAECDGQAGIQELAGNATLLYYLSEEGSEGKKSFLEKRPPNFSNYPWLP